jgi:polar amino acid transport system substrate-binding protein
MVKEGRSEGLAVEILDKALAKVDMKAVYIPENLAKLQELVGMGRADGIAVFAINSERKEAFRFSEPMLTTGGALFARESEPRGLCLDEWPGKIVCTPFKGPLARFIQERYPEVVVRDARDYPEALSMVVHKAADAAALNYHAGKHLARELFPEKFRMPDRIFLETHLAVAFLKGEKAAILERVSVGIRKLKEEKAYIGILQSWSQEGENPPRPC